jgi:hypothetical protein
MIKKYIFAGLLVVFATACTAQQVPSSPAPASPAAPPQTTPITPTAPIADMTLQNQEWGNDSLVLDIGTDSSNVNLACSNGTITQPFTIANQAFSLSGTYHPEGPPRALVGPDGTPETPDYSASFSGTIADGVMHFTITPKEGYGGSEYDLTKGSFTLRNQACPL